LIRVLLAAIAYTFLAWFGRLFVVQPENLASFWLPGGLALAMLLISEKRRWPKLLLGIFGANIVANMATGNTLIVSAAFGLANCVEPILGALLVDRILGTPLALTRLKDIVGLTVIAALFSNALTALLGAAVPSLAFGAPYWAVWRVWWIADALGIILVTPVIMTWASLDRASVLPFIKRRGVEAAVLFSAMVVFADFVFGVEVTDASFLLPFPYATFPFLLWAAVRFGLRGASLASLVLALVAVWYTAQRLGPFAATSESLSYQVLSTQAFLGVVTLSTLMLAAVIGERQQVQAALRAANDSLELRIQERTRELTDANQKLRVEVAERQRAEEEVKRSMAELARSNGELEQFAYVASHDLREPLRAVGGMVQLLEQRYKGQLDQRADEFITHIVDGVKRMQLLIDDLLAFARIGTPARAQSTDCEAIMKNVIANLGAAIQESGAVVTHEGLPTLKCDPTQMTQLLQNLVGNAIKFRGAARPEIQVKAELKEGQWVFVVRDNGIGIEPQYYERIFAIFQRLHTRRAYPGTGIGLAICKKIVTLHGGRIWVESAPGRGSSFYFTLPGEDLT
jgi:signal transduction histidine kinase